MKLVLDTSAYSRFRANHHGVVDLVARADVVCMPTVVLGELDAAFRLGRRLDDNRKRLDEFLHEDFVQVLPITAEVARRYGEVFVGLRRSGTPIPINDVWIAACTMDAAGHLATFDSDFMRVSALDHTLFEA